MAKLYPGAVWRPASNHSGPMSAHLGLILHVQVGENDLAAEFNNRASQASYTWVGYEDGRGDQFVDADLEAWAQAAGNGTYNSVGTRGFPSAPLTEACCVWIAGLYRWGHAEYGWPFRLAERPGEPGFGWHGMGGNAWGGHPGCPGDLRKAQRQHILDLAAAPVAVKKSTGDDDMNGIAADLFQPNQVDTFTVDGKGDLVHRWYLHGGNPGTAGGGWYRETLTAGLRPYSPVLGPIRWDQDGFVHLWAQRADDAQVELVWNGSEWVSVAEGV